MQSDPVRVVDWAMAIALISVTLSAGIVAYTLATIHDQAQRISELNDRVEVLSVRVTNYTEAVKVRGCIE